MVGTKSLWRSQTRSDWFSINKKYILFYKCPHTGVHIAQHPRDPSLTLVQSCTPSADGMESFRSSHTARWDFQPHLEEKFTPIGLLLMMFWQDRWENWNLRKDLCFAGLKRLQITSIRRTQLEEERQYARSKELNCNPTRSGRHQSQQIQLSTHKDANLHLWWSRGHWSFYGRSASLLSWMSQHLHRNKLHKKGQH